jgi:hypothetical protein
MIVDKTRELKVVAKLYVLYNDTPPLASGYYSVQSTGSDPENTTPVNRHNQQDRYQTLGDKKYNLTPSFFNKVPNLMNSHIPPVNPQIGAPRCTFAYGGIEPDKAHPIFNLLKGPTDQYAPNFIGTGIQGQEQEPKVPTEPDLNIPIMPFSTNNAFGASKVLTTYNIWALVDKDGNLTTTDSILYKGQYSTYNDAPVLQNKSDSNGESSIVLNSPASVAYIKRIFPLSKDVVYDTDSTIYAVKSTTDSKGSTSSTVVSQKVTERGSDNNSFHLSVAPSFFLDNQAGKDSVIIIKIGNASSKYNNVSYQFELRNGKYELFAITPNGQKLKQNVNISLSADEKKRTRLDIYMHFLKDIVLIGFTPDTNTWTNISPISQSKNSDASKNKFIHYLPANSTITMQCSYASCEIQYGPLAFNNFDSRSDDYRPHITFSHDTPSPTFELDPYTGYKNIKENGVSHYPDGRSNNSQLEFVNTYVNNGYGQVRYNSVIGGPVLHKIENRLVNSKGKPTYTIAADNSLLYPIGGQDPNKLPAYDISEYIESWEVRYSHQDSNLIFSDATVKLKNFDAGYSQDTKYNGMNILSLIEKNMIAIELSAGYNDETNIFFQGFILNTSTKRDASSSETEFTCSDVGKVILEDTQFKNFVYFAGSKIKYAIYRCFEHSGFHPYLRLYENPGYMKSLDANMSYTQLENKQVQANEGTPVISTLKTFFDDFFTKQSEMPFLRFDYSKQVFEVDWRYASKYRDNLKLFGIDLNDANSRDAYFKDNVEDWHGLLSGPFSVSTANGRFYTSYEARGLGYEGFSVSQYSYPQQNGFQAIVNGDYSIQGYVGFDKRLFKSLGQYFPDFLSVDTWLRNKINIHQKPAYTLNFSCYVTRPLNVHGSFVINSMMNNSSRVTDAYLYTNVTYQCNKKENIITALVTGQQTTKLEK